MKKGKPGNLYWISSGKKTWFYDLAKSLRKTTSCKINFISSPNYTKKVDVGNFIVDNSKLKSLGWHPKISLEEGIRKTLNSFFVTRTQSFADLNMFSTKFAYFSLYFIPRNRIPYTHNGYADTPSTLEWFSHYGFPVPCCCCPWFCKSSNV